jgi:sulfide:quinone oxidoreductase
MFSSVPETPALHYKAVKQIWRSARAGAPRSLSDDCSVRLRRKPEQRQHPLRRHYLVSIDAKARTASFEVVGGDKQGQRIIVPYDMLHVSPPQSPPEEIKMSPLVNAGGWVEVDQNTMQHVRHANVFALDDVTSTPNSKTAAAVRKQAPVVVLNILKQMAGQTVGGGYDGYASCPLTTAYGKAIIAEFVYGGKVTPTLPLLNPGKERWLGWWIKVTSLPILYWHYMLKAHEWFPRHNTAFTEPAAGN